MLERLVGVDSWYQGPLADQNASSCCGSDAWSGPPSAWDSSTAPSCCGSDEWSSPSSASDSSAADDWSSPSVWDNESHADYWLTLPSAVATVPKEPWNRVVAVDACNVMYHCKTKKDPVRDAIGLYLCAKQLMTADLDVKVFIPASYRWAKHIQNGGIIQILHKHRVLEYVPQGKHDDVAALEHAAQNGGCVLSNDHFKDHRGRGASIRETIRDRVLRFKATEVNAWPRWTLELTSVKEEKFVTDDGLNRSNFALSKAITEIEWNLY